MMKVGIIFRVAIAFSFALAVTVPVSAQLQTSYWVDGFRGQLDVSVHPPQIVGSSIWGGNGHMASIADENGILQFFTDGHYFYNKNNQRIGTSSPEVIWDEQMVCILPYPGRPNVYNMFMLGFPNNEPLNGYHLYQAVVDMNAKTNIASPKKIITKIFGNAITATRTSNCDSYWIITRSADTMKSYYVDRNGIRDTAVNSKLNGIYPTTIKLAPDGKTATTIDGYTKEFNILDFDKSTGKFSIRAKGGSQRNPSYLFSEFSPDNKNLFVAYDSSWNDPNPLIGVRSNFELWVYNAQAKTDDDLANSATLLYQEKNVVGFWHNKMQLTPTGRIYLGFLRSGKSTIASINNPNAEKKEDFGFQPQLLDLNFGFVPLFPSFYFQNLNYPPSTISVNMGMDTVLCRGQNVELGSAPQEGYTYLWYSPNGNLNNPEISNPIVISPTNPKATYDTIITYVTVYDSVCRQGMDTIKVIYKPAAEGKINGSKSVCPGVDEIFYWIEGDTIKNGTITWSVSGGELFEHFHDSVTVNWGATNFNAHVKATSINSYGCPDFIDPFAVKIFKLLETEMPNGVDTLQCGIATQPYTIQGTNGSVYNWNVTNGQIDQGNGTNQIVITWDLNQKYGSVWIDESVNTELETCFGTSDTLQIVNPQAFLDENIHLYAISSDLDDATKAILHYTIQNPFFFKPESEVFWKPRTTQDWESSFVINNYENLYLHQFDKDIDDEYAFQLITHNICGIEVKSRINSNIFLTLQKDAILETLVLNWNKPSGWDNSEDYEIYRLRDDEQFMPYDHVPGNTLQKEIVNTLDGFHFQYYIIGYSSTDSPVPSLSNKTEVSFEHIPFIPNVITPNGDDLNDCLVIDKLDLYPDNYLSIYNRYGEKVFEQLNYQNTWDGDGLPSGIYYYYLTLPRNSKTFKGWVHVMR